MCVCVGGGGGGAAIESARSLARVPRARGVEGGGRGGGGEGRGGKGGGGEGKGRGRGGVGEGRGGGGGEGGGGGHGAWGMLERRRSGASLARSLAWEGREGGRRRQRLLGGCTKPLVCAAVCVLLGRVGGGERKRSLSFMRARIERASERRGREGAARPRGARAVNAGRRGRERLRRFRTRRRQAGVPRCTRAAGTHLDEGAGEGVDDDAAEITMMIRRAPPRPRARAALHARAAGAPSCWLSAAAPSRIGALNALLLLQQLVGALQLARRETSTALRRGVRASWRRPASSRARGSRRSSPRLRAAWLLKLAAAAAAAAAALLLLLSVCVCSVRHTHTHTATHSNTQQHTATHSNTRQHTRTHTHTHWLLFFFGYLNKYVLYSIVHVSPKLEHTAHTLQWFVGSFSHTPNKQPPPMTIYGRGCRRRRCCCCCCCRCCARTPQTQPHRRTASGLKGEEADAAAEAERILRGGGEVGDSWDDEESGTPTRSSPRSAPAAVRRQAPPGVVLRMPRHRRARRDQALQGANAGRYDVTVGFRMGGGVGSKGRRVDRSSSVEEVLESACNHVPLDIPSASSA